MDMIQVVVFCLLLGSVWTCKLNRCYSEQELSEAAERKLRSHYPQPPEQASTAASDSPASCPLDLYLHQQPLSDRSISPWTYVRVTQKDHYPSTYVEARCLCSGCIIIKNNAAPVLSQDYNSAPIVQSRVFLKREPCSDGKTYYLTPVSVNVAVGCTCARPNISS